MVKSLGACAILAFIIFSPLSLLAQDLTVSKDSIQVYNNPMMSFADEVIFTSHISTAVALDSSFITIAQMDTAGLSAIIAGKNLGAVWTAHTPTPANYQWLMDSVSRNTYKLRIDYPAGYPKPLSFSGNDTTSQIFHFQIGFCFFCGMLPLYPKYVKGTLGLFFSNGQVVELKLWSNDLRVGVRKSELVVKRETLKNGNVTCLANGKRVFASDRKLARKNQISAAKLYEKRN